MYGFRVYEFGVTEGASQRTRLDLSDPLRDGCHFVERLHFDVGQAALLGIRTGTPNNHTPGTWQPKEPERGDPQIRFLQSELRGPGRRVFFRMDYGMRGLFDNAMGDGEDVDLRHRAATTQFRCLLLAPEHGTKGLLAVEAVDRRCPIVMITSWLGRIQYEHDPHAWMRMRVKQVADREQIRKVVAESHGLTARLTERRATAGDGDRGDTVTLTQTMKSDVRKESLLAVALDWAQGGGGSEDVLRIEEIAGYDPEELEAAGLRFDRAAIIVEDKDGKSKTLKPENIRALFTYEINQETQPDDILWMQRVVDKMRGTLSEGTDIQF